MGEQQFRDAGWEQISPGIWLNRRTGRNTAYCGSCSALRAIDSSVACHSRNFNGDLEWYAEQGARPRRGLLVCGHYVTYVGRAQ